MIELHYECNFQNYYRFKTKYIGTAALNPYTVANILFVCSNKRISFVRMAITIRGTSAVKREVDADILIWIYRQKIRRNPVSACLTFTSNIKLHRFV